jgi:hypothetical protein
MKTSAWGSNHTKSHHLVFHFKGSQVGTCALTSEDVAIAQKYKAAGRSKREWIDDLSLLHRARVTSFDEAVVVFC